MKLLMHACCGPCSLEPVRILQKEHHDITLYFSNSNIAPLAEYHERLHTIQAWAHAKNLPFIEEPYQAKTWESIVGAMGDKFLEQHQAKATNTLPAENSNGHASEAFSFQDSIVDTSSSFSQNGNEPARISLSGFISPSQRESRCRACYRLRLEDTARIAAQHGYEAIGTTLSISPYQYTHIIEEETLRAANKYGVTALFRDFRPYYEEATRTSKELGLYRQNYCGCRFSYEEACAQRAERKAARAAARAQKQAQNAQQQAAAEAAREQARKQQAAYAEKRARQAAIKKQLRAHNSALQ